MSRLARIAVLAGDTPGARAVAGAVTSLLTAVGRWVEELPAGADLAPYTAVILPRSRSWRAVRERHAGPLLVVDADLLGGRADLEFRRLLGEPPLASASKIGRASCRERVALAATAACGKGRSGITGGAAVL